MRNAEGKPELSFGIPHSLLGIRIDDAPPSGHAGNKVADFLAGSGVFSMRTLVSSLVLICCVGMVLAADDPPAKKKKDTPTTKKDSSSAKKKNDAPLHVGGNLPGPFHPYNVTGPYKQHFHSLISEHDLDPMVMIFYKSVDFSDPLPDLLKRLDTAIAKNPDVRLGSFAVFLPEDLSDVVGGDDKTDDARLKLEKQIDQAASDMKLKNVVLCMDTKADVDKYGLSESNLITVVLYTKLKVVAVYALPKSDFTPSAIDKIMADVADKLGAKRK